MTMLVFKVPDYDAGWFRRFCAQQNCQQSALFRFFISRVLRARTYGERVVEDAVTHAWKKRRKHGRN